MCARIGIRHPTGVPMKKHLQRLEALLLASLPARLIVTLLIKVGRRLLWLWGRIRFGVLVCNRGPGCVCHWNTELKYPGNLHLGERVIIGINVSLGAHSPITLGDNVRLSREVILETAGLDFSSGTPPYKHISRPIVLEEGVWVGARAIVLGGVTVGCNAVIAAGAVVTRSVPAGATVAGIPARIVKAPH